MLQRSGMCNWRAALMLCIGVSGAADAANAQGVTCIDGANVRVCVAWALPTSPAAGVDFAVSFGDPDAPTITLITGNGGWIVNAERLSDGSPANIALLDIAPANHTAKFGVKIADGPAAPGAANVGAINLTAVGWSGHSSLADGSWIAGDLTGNLAVQRAGTDGGEVYLSIGGSVAAASTLAIPVLRSLSVGGNLLGDVVVGEVLDGYLTVGGDVAAGASIDVAALSNFAYIHLSRTETNDCAGNVLLRNGLPLYENQLIIGNLSGTVDLNGGDIGGWFEVEFNGSGDLLNGGVVRENGAVTFTSIGTFDGTASLAGVDGFAFVRIHGGVFDGQLTIDGTIQQFGYVGTHGGDFLANARITVTGDSHGTIRIGEDGGGWTGNMPGAIDVQGNVGASGLIEVDNKLGGSIAVGGNLDGDLLCGRVSAGAVTVGGNVGSAALVELGPLSNGASITLSFSDLTQCAGLVRIAGMTDPDYVFIGGLQGTVDFSGGDVDGWFELEYDSAGDIINGGVVRDGAQVTFTSVGTFSGTASFAAVESFAFLRIHGGVFDGALTIAGDMDQSSTIVTHGGDFGPNSQVTIGGSLAGQIWLLRLGTTIWTGDLPGTISVGAIKGSGAIRVEGDLTGAITVAGTVGGGIYAGEISSGHLLIGGDVALGATIDIDAIGGPSPSGGPSVRCNNSAAVFAGALRFASGIGANAFVEIQAKLDSTALIDLFGGDLEGQLFLAGGSGLIDNIGVIRDTGLLLSNPPIGSTFAGTIVAGEIDEFGIIRFEGGKVDGAVKISNDLRGLVMWGPGDLLKAGTLNVGGDVTATGQIRFYQAAPDFSGDCAGVVSISGDLAGVIAADGLLTATGRVDVYGQVTGSIDLARGMKTGGQLRMRGLAASGLVQVNSVPSGNQALGGLIRVDGNFGGIPAQFVTFDGRIRVNPQDLGIWQGTIAVVGCHQTPTPLDICVCGTDQGTIRLVQSLCPTQVTVQCGDPCP